MKLCELQKEAYAIAESKGWHDRDDEVTFGDRIALVHSELSEALEAYREHGLEPWGLYPYIDTPYDEPPPKSEGVAYELADVVIRVASMAEHYGVDLAQEVEHTGPPVINDIMDIETFGDWISAAHWQLAGVAAKYRGSRPTALLMYLPSFVRFIYVMAEHYGIDLDASTSATMEYNRTREYRHGGRAL